MVKRKDKKSIVDRKTKAWLDLDVFSGLLDSKESIESPRCWVNSGSHAAEESKCLLSGPLIQWRKNINNKKAREKNNILRIYSPPSKGGESFSSRESWNVKELFFKFNEFVEFLDNYVTIIIFGTFYHELVWWSKDRI